MFTNRIGGQLSRSGIKYILDKYVEIAKSQNPTMFPENISPHTLRHTKAMHMLQAGNNIVYIRDILGHSSIDTTSIYARADTEMKRKAMELVDKEVTPNVPDWRSDNALLDWLKQL